MSALRSRLVLGTGLLGGASLVTIAVVPSQTARVILALLVATVALPAMTVGPIRHLVDRGSSEIKALAVKLDGQISLVERAQDDSAERHERLADAMSMLIRQADDERSQWMVLGSQMVEQHAAIVKIRDEIRERDRKDSTGLTDLRALIVADQAGQRDRLEVNQRTIAGLADALRPLVGIPQDPLSVPRALLRVSGSAVVVYAGVADRSELLSGLGLAPNALAVDLDDPEAPEVPADPVETVVAVAGTRTDLRRLAVRSDELPEASRVLVIVLRSTRLLPLPTLANPARLDRIVGWRLTRSHANGWTCDVSFSPPASTGDVILSLGRLTGIRAVASAAPYPEPAEVGTAACSIDIRTINPIGFRTDPEHGMATLQGPAVVNGEKVVTRLQRPGHLTEVDIAALRQLRGVTVEWATDTATAAVAVFGLAMAGIPLCIPTVPSQASRLLGPVLTNLVSSIGPELFEDALSREECSIRLRRCALRQWCEGGSAPAVSVLLCTRRPEMIPFALEQLGRQRAVDLEIVLGLHGVDPNVDHIEHMAKDLGLRCSIAGVPADIPFGLALNRLALQASGSVLAKMDDDDWYGPDHLSDLLLAREYSQADLVGCSAEFVYLEELDRTVRRPRRTEVFDHRVGGGAMIIDRVAFDEVGGFPHVAVGEDQALQRNVVNAGGRLYRTHGLGFVLRRRPTGHTWNVDTDFFVQDARRSWPGLYFTAMFDG